MRKLVHNGLLYVESEEGEKSMKKELIQVTEFNILEEITVEKWTKLFGGGYLNPCVLDTDSIYNHSTMNRRMIFRCTYNYRARRYWVWEVSISQRKKQGPRMLCNSVQGHTARMAVPRPLQRIFYFSPYYP